MEKLDKPTQEEWFDFWCADMIEAGYITKVQTTEDYNWIDLFAGMKQTKQVEKVLYKGTKREKITKVTKSQTLLMPIKYKPDRVIWWADKAKDIFFTPLAYFKDCYFAAHRDTGRTGSPYFSPVEVKAPPGYGGSNTSDASFRVKQKWVWEKAGIFVNKVYNNPTGMSTKNKVKVFKAAKPYLWMSTFTPRRYMLSNKTLVPRSIKTWVPITLEEFVEMKKALLNK